MNNSTNKIYQLVDVLDNYLKRTLIDNFYYAIIKGLSEGWSDATIAILARYTQSYTTEIINKTLDFLSLYYGTSLTRDNFKDFFEGLTYESENNS